MDLKLISNTAYLEGSVASDGKPIRVYVETRDSKKYYVKINSNPKIEFKNYFDIQPHDLKRQYLEFIVEEVDAAGKYPTKVYKSDKLKLYRAVVLGESLENPYPAALENALNEIEQMKKEIKIMEQSIIEIAKKGEIL